MDLNKVTILVTNLSRVDEYIAKFDSKFRALGKIGFIKTPSGYVATEDDSVHFILENEDEVINFSLMEDLGGGRSRYVTKTAKFPFKELVNLDLLDEMPLVDFLNVTQGSRRRDNFALLVDTLQKEGLDN